MKLPKINFTLTQIARLQIIVLAIITLLVLSYSAFFLYQNFYKSLTNTEKIIVLHNQITLEKINLSYLNNVTSALEEKKAVPEIDWETSRNPFLPYQSGSETTETQD